MKATLAAVASVFLAGCAHQPAPSASNYESCEAAQTAVSAAGQTGLMFGGERIYGDRFCFNEGDPRYVYFDVERTIGGKQCRVGWSCIEVGGGAGG